MVVAGLVMEVPRVLKIVKLELMKKCKAERFTGEKRSRSPSRYCICMTRL
jgi:hypothetical protein